MLILSRREGESIFLGEDIEVRLVEISGSRVKLGVVAPRQLRVERGEVREAARANRDASNVPAADQLAGIVARLRAVPKREPKSPAGG